MPDVPEQPSSQERPPASAWAEMRAVLGGAPRDYTSGSTRRAVVLLAVPMVLEMSMQSLFAVIDMFFVSRLGAEPVAVLGLTGSLLALVFSIALGLSMGTTAMVARRIGEREPDQAAQAAVQAILVALALSALLGIGGALGAPSLLRLMGAQPEVVERGSGFAAIMLGGNATIMLLFVINAIFRGAGDAVRAMYALWLANGINIVLDPLLIFGLGPFPELGLEGAAWATTLARGLGVLYQLIILTRPGGRLRIERRHLAPRLSTLLALGRVSAVGVLQFLVSMASFVGLVRIMALFGTSALAGYTIAIRVMVFILLPAFGVGNAAATLVGQNLGAGKPERAERSVWMTARYNAGIMALVAIVLWLFTPLIVPVFTDAHEVAATATQGLRAIAYSYPFWGFGMVAVQAFNGAGDTTTPTWINLLAYWLLEIPLAWALAVQLELGPVGVFASISVAQAALAALGLLLFRRGSWKRRAI